MNELQSIEESDPLGHVSSSMIQAKQNVLFAVEKHYGALMTIPDNNILLWPGLTNRNDEKVDLLPNNNLVS